MTETKKVEGASNIRFRIFEGEKGRVLVNHLNGDRFVLSIQEVVNACGAFSRQADLSKQAELLFQKLGEWSCQRSDVIRSSHLTIRDSSLLFVVVQKGRAFDQGLCDDLVGLDLDIAGDPSLDLIHLDVLAIPAATPEAVAAFTSLETLV
jgi:hypothetical protein